MWLSPMSVTAGEPRPSQVRQRLADVILLEKGIGNVSTASPFRLLPGPFLGPVQSDILVNSRGSATRLCRFKSQIYHLIITWPSAIYLISKLHCIICKMGW